MCDFIADQAITPLDLNSELLEVSDRELLLEKIKKLENELNETKRKLESETAKLEIITNKPKTSPAQLKATKKYLKSHPEITKETKKRYYLKKSQDPDWLAEQSRIRCENYHKKKIELKQIEKDKELINYLN